MSVYFIACGGFIKIGFSEDPERRTAKLFASSSRYSAPRAAYHARGTQELIGVINGNKNTEHRLHLALDDYAAGCEWFIDEPELRDYLAALDPNGHPRTAFARLTRSAGPLWDELDPSARGGGHFELAMSVHQRRTA